MVKPSPKGMDMGMGQQRNLPKAPLGQTASGRLTTTTRLPESVDTSGTPLYLFML